MAPRFSPMTSDEIKQKEALDFSQAGWLREIAYQLALLNEKQAPEVKKTPKVAK